MTNQSNEDRAAALRAQWEAELKAEERARAQARHGVLWGAWTPERLVCRSCGADIVEPDQQAAFLDVDQTFQTDTLIARSVAAYDLMRREVVNIPDWINAESELWRAAQSVWSSNTPDEIIQMATVQGPRGRYGEYSRVCDAVSHVFVRACPHCPDTDPLNLRGDLLNHGMERVDPPHAFLDVLRSDQDTRQNRARALRQHTLQASVKSKKAPDYPAEDCQKCGAKRKPGGRFCTKCGHRFPD